MIKQPYKFFFHTLANKSRLEIVHALLDGEMNVTELTKKLRIKQSTISHNLKRLLLCRFIHIRREGPFRYYSLNKETIEPLLKLIDKHVNKFCKKVCQRCLSHEETDDSLHKGRSLPKN
jgi:DNA-binding transcriptional ArsR family regulator